MSLELALGLLQFLGWVIVALMVFVSAVFVNEFICSFFQFICSFFQKKRP